MDEVASIFIAIAIVFGLVCFVWFGLVCLSILVDYGVDNQTDTEEIIVNKIHHSKMEEVADVDIASDMSID
jgi:hypothetical protein